MTNPNEPAFPLPEGKCNGLSKREYFAALAMQGILANPSNDHMKRSIFPEAAVAFADLLIAELNKEPLR